MFKKIKLGTGEDFSLKKWVAAFLFGAIIVVFALWGVHPDTYGDRTGGVAAVVNDASISLAEYRSRVEMVEQNARMNLDQFPEEQRRRFSQELRRRALDELILGELIYQEASNRGVRAADSEIRDVILQIPFLQENGRFLKDRYRNFLASRNLSSEDFEHQLRKQIVTQKVQELFLGSAAPTREELKRNRYLANQKVNIRFVELSDDDFRKPGFIDAAEVAEFLKTKKADVENYYNDNRIEFTFEERVRARHILIRIDEKRNEDAAKSLAEQLHKQATPANFASLARKHSDDRGSRDKGGDLGEFTRGQMVPEFETAAFAMKDGEISQPVKTNFGYHLIYLEKKLPAETLPLSQVEKDIARKLLVKAKQSEIVNQLRSTVESGSKAQVEKLITKAGATWTTSGEFDLSSPMIPKLGENNPLLAAIIRTGKSGGLVRQLIERNGQYLVAEVISWKEDRDPGVEVEGTDRMVAFRKANDMIENWSREIETRASIQRNPRLSQF